MSEIVIGNRVGGKGRKREEEEEKKMKFNGYGTTVMAKRFCSRSFQIRSINSRGKVGQRGFSKGSDQSGSKSF